MPIFIADHDFDAEGDTELGFVAGQQVEVITQKGEWWYGELIGSRNATGKESEVGSCQLLVTWQ